MASHHHLHRHREHHPLSAALPATSSCSCCCCYGGGGGGSPCCTQSRHSSRSPPADHLLHLVLSHLQQQQQERECSDQTHLCETSYRGLNGLKHHRFLHQPKNIQRDYDPFVLSCLLRRIEDLESSLHRFSVSSENRKGSYWPLRDSAARVIQTHFRSYLVRRSRSLRQLKALAAIKSSFLSLRSSVSGKTHVPFEAVSREAMDLLLQLDSIRCSDDPMVRDAKRSLSRDLVMFLKFLDGYVVKKHETLRKSAKNVRFIGSRSRSRSSVSNYQNFGKDKSKNAENFSKRIKKIYISSNGDDNDNVGLDEFYCVTDDGEEVPMVLVNNGKGGNSKARNRGLVQSNESTSRVTKTMRFNKNGNEYWVYGDVHEPNSSLDDDWKGDDEEIPVISFDNEKGHLQNVRKGVLVKANGGKAQVVKTVSFDEKGNVHKVYGNTPEATSSGEYDDSTNESNDERKENGCDEVEEIKCEQKENEDAEEKARPEDEEDSSSQSSDRVTSSKRNINHLGKDEYKREFQLRNGNLLFSPPLPLKMEP